jgi:addiction module HigA family antidote
MHNPAHPGEILREYFGSLSVSAAAAHLGMSRVNLSRILNGKAGISAEMSLRLADALGTSPDLWLKMQVNYDPWVPKITGNGGRSSICSTGFSRLEVQLARTTKSA